MLLLWSVDFFSKLTFAKKFIQKHYQSVNVFGSGFYTKLNVWGSLGLNFEYDGGPIIEIGGPIFIDKLRILEGSTSFHEGSVLSPGQLF